MTPVSIANSSGCGIEFIVRGRSFIYVMNNRGTRIDCWGTLCFNALKPEKKTGVELGDLTATFCLS